VDGGGCGLARKNQRKAMVRMLQKTVVMSLLAFAFGFIVGWGRL